MSKKPLKSTVKSTNHLTENKPDASNVIITIIIALFLLVECTPKLQLQDQMGVHWLLISIVNGLALIYIFTSKKIISNADLFKYSKNGITILFSVFVVLAGVSIVNAINPIESLVVYSRLLTTILSFFIIGVLLVNRLHLLNNIALIITVIASLQAFETVLQFYREVEKTPIDTLIYNLQGTSGNKNIFAAAFVVKIPFMIYYIFKKEGFLKYFSIVGIGLVFFALFLINARSAFLGIMLSLFILLLTLGYVYWKEKNLKFYFIQFAFVASAFAATFFISQQSLTKATQDKSSTYSTISDRLGGIADQTTTKSNIRLAYWKGSYELIKERPLLGVGYGNWKIYAPLYTNTLLDDNTFSKHPHNDFIEMAGETGIPNALAFLAIFAMALFFTVKVILADANQNTKIISLVAFTALTGYFVDAFFNFPAERPNVQILFALGLALLLANWMSLKPKQQDGNEKYNLAKRVALILMLFCGVSIYVNAMVYKSSKAQYITDNDFAAIDNIPNALPKLKYEEVKNIFPSIPNIGENSETIGYKKARYLYKEKRYAEAIKLLDSVHHQSPNIIYDDYLKCNIYLEEKKLDSAYKYGKKAAYAKPRNFYYYRMASYLARVHEDVPEINKLFNNYSKYRDDQQSWSYYSLSMFFSKADRKEVKKVVDMGLKKFPTDTIMLSYVPYLPK